MAANNNEFNINIGTEVDQKGLKKGLKDSENQVKSFAKGATQALTGIDFSKLVVPAGLAALGVAGLKAIKSGLDDMAASYRQQEAAELALQNAAKGNPYLNDSNVRQLKEFANETQRITGLDSQIIIQTETRLASLGRNQQQMEDIIRAAADVSARGIMDFDTAVSELNRSLNGVVGRTSGMLIPALKDLTAEQLAAGKAVELFNEKFGGAAAAAMESGVGSVLAYKNAISDLRKQYGEDWENATRGFRNAITNYINNVVDAKNKTKELEEVIRVLGQSGDQTTVEYLDASMVALSQLVETNKRHITAMKKDIEDAERAGFLGNVIMSQASRNLHLQRIQELEAENHQTQIRLQLDQQLLTVRKALESAAEATAQIAERTGTLEAIEAQNRALEAQAAGVAAIQAQLQAVHDNNQAAFVQNRQIAQQMQAQAEAAEEAAKAELARYEEAEKAQEIINKNKDALDEEIKKIERRAELEGKSLDDIEVRKQILDAETTAYENLLTSAKDYLDLIESGGVELSEKQTLDYLKQQWQVHQNLQRTEEERKKRLAELTKQQEELASRLNKIYEDAQGDSKRQTEIAREKDYQDNLLKIREQSIEKAAEYEINVARDRAILTANERKKELEANKIEQEKALDELLQAELAKYKEGHPARLEIEKEFQQKREELAMDTARAIIEIEKSMNGQLENIEHDRLKTMQEAHVEAWKKAIDDVREYVEASRQIASSISTLWTNIIDYQTEKKLKKNDEMIQSDEERAIAEKKIMIEAANERYKAELFAWSANVTAATATAAMAMLNAYAEGLKGGGSAAAAIASAQMALAAIVGTMQIAAVASAIPKPPRFHTGGVVQGRSGAEVPAILQANETVLTQGQFKNTMQAISNLAEMRGGGGGVSLNLTVENNAGDVAQASFDPNSMRVTIEKITGEAIASGRLNQSFENREYNLRGGEWT